MTISVHNVRIERNINSVIKFLTEMWKALIVDILILVYKNQSRLGHKNFILQFMLVHLYFFLHICIYII